MEKVKQWLDNLIEKSAFAQGLQWDICEGKGEGYQVSIAKGKLRVKAQSWLAGAFAFHQLDIARKAGHLAEWIGEAAPRFDLRPVWIPPDIIKEANIENLCRKTIAFGGNAWIVGSFSEGMFSEKVEKTWSVSAWCAVLHSYGLKLFVKPQFQRTFGNAAVCPIDSAYGQELNLIIKKWSEDAQECDGLFWESPHLEPGFENSEQALDCLHADLLLSELKLIEEALGGQRQLIYYLPAKGAEDAKASSQALGGLCDAAGQETVIAFPAVAGRPSDDHLSLHPFWNELRRVPDCSGTGLLPIINGGGVLQGEGLWPGLAVDLFHEYIPRCYRHKFSGAAIMANTLPNPGTFLEGSLWVGFQSLWREISPEILKETWLSAYRPKENYEALPIIRQIIKEISYLRSAILAQPADGKLRVEKTIAAFKCLDQLIPNTGQLAEYYPFFAKDAKRMLAQIARHLSVPTPNLVPPGSMDECFWADTIYGPSQWRRSDPRRGEKGSKMEAILIENGFEN